MIKVKSILSYKLRQSSTEFCIESANVRFIAYLSREAQLTKLCKFYELANLER